MVILLLFLSVFVPTHAKDNVLSVRAQQHAKMNLLVCIIGSETEENFEIAKTLQKNLQWSGQFQVTTEYIPKMLSKKEIKERSKKYQLGIFVSKNGSKFLDWRMYDLHITSMLKGKKYKKRGACVRGWAHNISDAIWPELTGHQGLFSTKIAYCRQVEKKGKRAIKHIYIADYDGSHEQPLVTTETVSVAPRWNTDTTQPLLFYSEYTTSNVCLMVSNMKKQHKVAANFDGITMIPSFSRDGKKVVFCASRGDGHCQLYAFEKGELKRLTHNYGNNISPSLTADGKRVYYCSDAQTGRPQIYCYDMALKKNARITNGGYCASPSYSQKHGKLAYTKIIQGASQLFIYDEKDQSHTQLTSDYTNKDECCWSPCGNYLLFSADHKGKSRVAMLNLLTNERRYLTSARMVSNYRPGHQFIQNFPL